MVSVGFLVCQTQCNRANVASKKGAEMTLGVTKLAPNELEA